MGNRCWFIRVDTKKEHDAVLKWVAEIEERENVDWGLSYSSGIFCPHDLIGLDGDCVSRDSYAYMVVSADSSSPIDYIDDYLPGAQVNLLDNIYHDFLNILPEGIQVKGQVQLSTAEFRKRLPDIAPPR